MVGVLQNTNTFKSLARQSETAHLWGGGGMFARVVLLGSVSPAVCAGRCSRYVWKIDSCTITEIAAACVVPSSAESPQSVVQCNVQDARTNVSLLAQYYNVKNITREL